MSVSHSSFGWDDRFYLDHGYHRLLLQHDFIMRPEIEMSTFSLERCPNTAKRAVDTTGAFKCKSYPEPNARSKFCTNLPEWFQCVRDMVRI